MLDVTFARQNFEIVNGRLFRRFAGGRLKAVDYVKNRASYASVRGRPEKATHIAWALYYGDLPPRGVRQIDKDPLNLARENLIPCIGTRIRFRPGQSEDGFWHNLNSKLRVASEEEAFADWCKCVWLVSQTTMNYMVKLAPVLEVAMERRTRPVEREPKSKEIRPKKPIAGPGRAVYWWGEVWLDVPAAVHPSDDWQVRCQWIAAGADGMRFDPTLGRCVPYWAQAATTPEVS